MSQPNPDRDIPWAGVQEVLRGWSGKGQLYEALASPRDNLDNVRWTRRDIERRAHRILFAELLPLLERWPTDRLSWLSAIPAESTRRRRVTTTLGPGTDWVATRVQGGWPPERFVVRDRSRAPQQIMVRTLRWVLDRLKGIREDAIAVERSLRSSASSQCHAALSLLRTAPVVEAAPVIPVPAEIDALRMAGAPWTQLAPVAIALRQAELGPLIELARRHLTPSEDLTWRLFHLGVLGNLLRRLRQAGGRTIDYRPLSGATYQGPNYRIQMTDNTEWDLWFESSRSWAFYNEPSPYATVTTGVIGGSDAAGADILLIRRGVAATVFECKYGTPGYVRSGYHQACSYAMEARSLLVPKVRSFVIGPDSMIDQPLFTEVDGVQIAVLGARQIDLLSVP